MNRFYNLILKLKPTKFYTKDEILKELDITHSYFKKYYALGQYKLNKKVFSKFIKENEKNIALLIPENLNLFFYVKKGKYKSGEVNKYKLKEAEIRLRLLYQQYLKLSKNEDLAEEVKTNKYWQDIIKVLHKKTCSQIKQTLEEKSGNYIQPKWLSKFLNDLAEDNPGMNFEKTDKFDERKKFFSINSVKKAVEFESGVYKEQVEELVTIYTEMWDIVNKAMFKHRNRFLRIRREYNKLEKQLIKGLPKETFAKVEPRALKLQLELREYDMYMFRIVDWLLRFGGGDIAKKYRLFIEENN